MLGLFGTLNLGTRALQTQRQGVEVAGQNLANVNNTAYARQRLDVQTSATLNSEIGPQGTGVDAVAIVQLRSTLLDTQIVTEASSRGYLDAQQLALQNAQNNLGASLDLQTNGTDAAASSQSVGTTHGIGNSLNGLFSAFQAVSTDPTSLANRQTLVTKAQDLTTRFNEADQRLGELTDLLNTSVQADTTEANKLLASIASLNGQISQVEASGTVTANDLRDLRQQKLESLAALTNIDVSQGGAGMVDVSIAGTTFVSGKDLKDTLATYAAGGGNLLLKAQTAGTPLTLNGGSLAGTIDARDGDVAKLRGTLNTLASTLISEVNTVYRAGYDLNGNTGADFFTGTGAADIQVNVALSNDPAKIQAAGTAGAAGDNQTALALAQLATKSNPALGNQTFTQSYSQTVAALGQSLATVNTKVADQKTMEDLLHQQRDSVSGVSLDEEMTSMMQYQKAFEASAKLIATVAAMLDTVISMKQ